MSMPFKIGVLQLSMEPRVLQEAAGKDRFLLGLGASKIFMKEIGEGEKGKEVGPATVMRESIEIIEAMLAGNEVKDDGRLRAQSGQRLFQARSRFGDCRQRRRGCKHCSRGRTRNGRHVSGQ